MSAPQPGPREITSGFTDAMLPALPADAPALARVVARDVAQIMGLPGLEAALAQLEQHHGPTRPIDVQHLAARLARMVEQAAQQGDLSLFHAADRELGAIASQLETTNWSTPERAPAPAVATWTVGETLADMRLDGGPELENTRLTMNVASALRAAIDWLGADESPRVVGAVHDSAMTLTVSVGHEGGIGPAGAVLAAVEGSLGREADGRWTLRLPRCTERPSFLLVRQGRFGFALPWHSVARLRMFAPHELDRLTEPRLDSLASLAPTTAERPAAMIALGLSRAWFIADRIVWRIAASPEEAETAGPFAGTTRVVAVESGERYWLLEPGWLLRGIAAPDVAPPSPRPRVSTTTIESLPLPMPAPAAAPAPVVTRERRPGESLADAVERALDSLRAERAASVRTAVRPAAEAPPIAPAVDADALVDSLLDFDSVPEVAAEPAIEPTPAPDATPEPQASAPAMMFQAQMDVIAPEPAADVAPAEAPIVEEPVVEAPVVEEPVVEAPVVEEPVVEAPVVEEPVVEAPVVEEPVVEAPIVEAATVEAPAVPEPVVEIAPVEAPAVPEPVVEIAPVEAPVVAPPLAPAAETPSRSMPRPSEIAESAPARRALVVDDSLVARIFLGRLLEKRGWIVECVSDAAGMWTELRRGSWELVCADYALPDAQGRDHVANLLDFVARRSPVTQCIVLTRDAEEERVARDAGAAMTLRKPFDSDRLDTLLVR